MRAIHLSRAARERHGFGAGDLGPRGFLQVDDLARARRTAARINADRAAERAPGEPTASAGELVAMGVLHDVFHRVLDAYREQIGPEALTRASASLERRLGRKRVEAVGQVFAQEFAEGPARPPGHSAEPPPTRAEVRAETLQELLLLALANENPAAGSLRDLFDDSTLRKETVYPRLLADLEAYLVGVPGFGPGGESLPAMLRAPMAAAPTSLAGQLRWIRDHWVGRVPGLDDLLARLLLAIDVITEEERSLHLRFGGVGGFGGVVEAPSFSGLEDSPERFSQDTDWMPRLVLLAKSSYVWLDQLSREFGRDIRTLAAIPDEALDRLRGWGVTGLWLIGLWQRSGASERIKRIRGNTEAVASAYSLDDYRIADDLGGEDALADLRERAWARGIRLSADMVPNHMGLDSRWVIDHPTWFLSVPEPPFPSYTYTGPDLSSDARVGIVLEDHYWTDTDAAVTFKRFDRWSGEARYVYHGNDGTSLPWNDTAQLDYLDPDAREAVIRTIIDVARRFPVIRFDAAMVLARKHVQRLWYPRPGDGGGIASRAEHAISQRDFDRAMPAEFWREVVDRVAAEAPDTLLLAEAFWLMEGYFVRTLGMHRVYNSAFMHMLRDEDNAGYRKVMKDTLEFDPEILQRYVNFMNNPDERTAVDQFGKDDKYFGVATLLATLPGLPMIGHGQVEGFAEKYGMEFRRASMVETPDPWLVARHEREIVPLLHARGRFAGVADFLLYDFEADGGGVGDDVYAYSNGAGPERSLVVYHNRFAATSGRIRGSVAIAVKATDGSKGLRRGSLGEGLGLSDDPDALIAWSDLRTGLESLHRARDLWNDGLWLDLGAYRCHVFWGFRELSALDGAWGRLADRLGGRPVPSLDEALRDLELEPVHEPLAALFEGGAAGALLATLGSSRAATAKAAGAVDELARRCEGFYAAAIEALDVPGDPKVAAGIVWARLAAIAGARFGSGDVRTIVGRPLGRAALFGWAVLGALGDGSVAVVRFDALRLAGPIVEGLSRLGVDNAAEITARIRALLALGSGGREAAALADVAPRIRRWLADPTLREAIGVNAWDGVEWIRREAWDDLVTWSHALELVAIASSAATPAEVTAARRRARLVAERLRAAAAAADYRVDRLMDRDGRSRRAKRS